MILAAGKGTRLGDITFEIPKPMIQYKGKPLLEYNLNLCVGNEIREIFINTHHLADTITSYFKDGEKFGAKITYSYEEKLLGTAGALNNFKKYLSSEPFFVIYGDNVCEFPLNKLIDKFNDTGSLAVIAFHYREDVSQSGIAEFGYNDKILRFIEKPSPGISKSKWVNAGIYLLSPKIFKFIPNGFSDFAKDIFPNLLEKGVDIYGVRSEVKLNAFDTLELLKKSKSEEKDN